MSEILNPDRNKASDLGSKAFISSASVGGKQADTRTFAFGRSAAFGGRDGKFQTRSFTDHDKFRTGDYATKADRAGGNSFAAADRGFGTKAVPVEEAPAANKSAAGIRKYVPGDKSIVVRGKRQDDLDDLYHQKNLSIDQVREILNKPGRGTDAPAQAVGAAPALRAQPVTAPADR